MTVGGRFGDAITTSGPADVATGRGITYEWEQFLFEVFDRLAVVEEASDSGGGGGTQGDVSAIGTYVHNQTSAAATWTINHGLDTKPVVVVVSAGTLVFAEVAYPNDTTVVITFGRSFAGTAYLRG